MVIPPVIMHGEFSTFERLPLTGIDTDPSGRPLKISEGDVCYCVRFGRTITHVWRSGRWERLDDYAKPKYESLYYNDSE